MAIVVGCSYLISSCTNELDAIEDEDRVEQFFLNEEQKLVIEKLDIYMKEFIRDASYLYNANDYIDRTTLNSKIMGYDIATKTKSQIDESSNILYSGEEYAKDYLSPDAYNLIMAFIEKGVNSKDEYAELIAEASTLNAEEQLKLKFVFAIADMFMEDLNSIVATKALSGLSCNIMYEITGSVTGAIWGAAFAGPVGAAVTLAWGIAFTCVAYYEC